MCLGRRHTKCTCCGGHFASGGARAALFNLGSAPGDAAIMATLASLDRSSGQQGASRAPAGGGLASRQRLIDEMDALANEIMTD
jgi:hypothetical protein